MLDIYNVLDAISEIVYVSDAETHEILYINEAGKKILGDCLGETCYKLFHGKSSECTNCPCLNGEGLSEYIRENVMTEKHILLNIRILCGTVKRHIWILHLTLPTLKKFRKDLNNVLIWSIFW